MLMYHFLWDGPYLVRYVDQGGNEHRAQCKSRFSTGIYFSHDRSVKPLAPADRQLKWKATEPRPSPLSPITGDFTEYRVHFATTTVDADSDFQDHLAQTVGKAVSFAAENISSGITRLLFLWDVVYSMLTVVYTDETMTRDAPHVVKCVFTAIDEQFRIKPGDFTSLAVAEDFSRRVRRMLEEFAASGQFDGLPATIGIYYSDSDLASRGSDGLVVHGLR